MVSAADVAAADAAAEELLAELEAQAQRAQQPNANRKKRKKKNAKHKQKQQLQPQQQPKQNGVISKPGAPMQMIGSVVPRPGLPVPRELSANSSQVEPSVQLSKHSSPSPSLEHSSKSATLMRPTPIVTNSKVEAPPCTVLVNSTQTAEEAEHQTTIRHPRMRLEAEHQRSIIQLEQQHQISIQHLRIRLEAEHQRSIIQLEQQHQVSIQHLGTRLEAEYQRSMQQSKLAEQEIAQLRVKTECAVCLDGDRNAVLFPCTHASCCYTCSILLEECPQCRSVVTNVIRIYSP